MYIYIYIGCIALAIAFWGAGDRGPGPVTSGSEASFFPCSQPFPLPSSTREQPMMQQKRPCHGRQPGMNKHIAIHPRIGY